MLSEPKQTKVGPSLGQVAETGFEMFSAAKERSIQHEPTDSAQALELAPDALYGCLCHRPIPGRFECTINQYPAES
jgi:hypothetical protein